jgi:hypothetical protein
MSDQAKLWPGIALAQVRNIGTSKGTVVTIRARRAWAGENITVGL